MGPISLEKQFWDLATTTSTAALMRLAKLGWLPPSTKLPLHRDWPWRWTWESCHWPWTVNSKIRKAKVANTTQSWRYLATLVATYNFAASLFCTYIYVGPFQTMVAGSWNLQFLRSLQVLQRSGLTWTQPIAQRGFWDFAFSTSTVEHLARLGWLPRQAKQLQYVKSTWISATQSWRYFRKRVATYDYAASLCRTAQSLGQR